MKLNPSYNSVAQTLHVALGALGVFVPVAMEWRNGQLHGSIFILVYAAIKEGWYDRHYENVETRGSGWLDFAFYAVGVVAANMLLAI
jgi:hypothetical protein